ncbi:MAG: hypothetical protein ACLFVE_12155 [Chitinispirillaceae bacterium]
MKKPMIILFMTLLFCTVSSSAQEEIPRFEIGVVLGEETGVSAKYWYTPRTAADASVAWAFGEVGMLAVNADYLFHPFYFTLYEGRMPLYIGVGGGVRISDDWFARVRLPVGLEYLFPELPLSAFAEIVPSVEVLPETVFNLSGGVGLRVTLGSVGNE